MRRPFLLLVVLTAACNHDAPFAPPRYQQPGPLHPGVLAQLTYNPGQDGEPSWLPDGSAFIYWRERLDRPDGDRCLAQMPADGGTITHQWCDALLAADDSTDAWQAPAPGPGGRLAFTRASSPPRAYSPLYADLVVATLADPATARVLRTLPAIAPDGVQYQGVAQIRWLDSTSLAYVAQQVTVGPFGADTVRSGLEIVRVDFVAAPVFTTVPGTSGATSLDVVGGDTLYHTLDGDSRVYRHILSTDSTEVAYDFGPTSVATDVQVAGDTLVAVVNDQLHLVRLSTGTDVTLTTPGLVYRHPSLARDASRVVMERVTGRTTDLWELRLR